MSAPQLRWTSFLIKEFNNIKSSLRFHACLLLLQDQLKYFILLYYKIKRYSKINLQRIFLVHTSYLSMLVHRHIIKACKKYAKKHVNLLQNSPIWSKFCGFLAKKNSPKKVHNHQLCGCDYYELCLGHPWKQGCQCLSLIYFVNLPTLIWQ